MVGGVRGLHVLPVLNHPTRLQVGGVTCGEFVLVVLRRVAERGPCAAYNWLDEEGMTET